jgi:hypothetical protein
MGVDIEDWGVLDDLVDGLGERGHGIRGCGGRG